MTKQTTTTRETTSTTTVTTTTPDEMVTTTAEETTTATTTPKEPSMLFSSPRNIVNRGDTIELICHVDAGTVYISISLKKVGPLSQLCSAI